MKIFPNMPSFADDYDASRHTLTSRAFLAACFHEKKPYTNYDYAYFFLLLFLWWIYLMLLHRLMGAMYPAKFPLSIYMNFDFGAKCISSMIIRPLRWSAGLHFFPLIYGATTMNCARYLLLTDFLSRAIFLMRARRFFFRAVALLRAACLAEHLLPPLFTKLRYAAFDISVAGDAFQIFDSWYFLYAPFALGVTDMPLVLSAGTSSFTTSRWNTRCSRGMISRRWPRAITSRA